MIMSRGPNYVVTITERTPTPPEKRETNTYHVFCDSMFEVAKVVEDFELNWGVLVSMTITPFKE